MPLVQMRDGIAIATGKRDAPIPTLAGGLPSEQRALLDCRQLMVIVAAGLEKPSNLRLHFPRWALGRRLLALPNLLKNLSAPIKAVTCRC